MALASGPGGVVAVGRDADGRATSWHSADGLSWAGGTAAFGTPAGDATIEVTDVIDTDTGWLAVGREDPFCQTDCGLDPVRALAWTSSDGRAWTRIADQPAFLDGAMRSVTRAGTGFVAVGSVGPEGATWTSSDLATWTRSTAPVFAPVLSSAGDAAVWVASVAAASGIVVAVGQEFPMSGSAPPTVRAWWSAAGASWVEGPGERFVVGVQCHPERTESTPDAFERLFAAFVAAATAAS